MTARNLAAACALVISVLAGARADAQVIYTSVYLMNLGNDLTSSGMASYRNAQFNLEPRAMSGWLAIGPCLNPSGYTFWNTWNPTLTSSWEGVVTCPGIDGECHRGRIEADDLTTPPVSSQAAGSPQICINTGGNPCHCDLEDEGGCPIVLNIGGGPWRLTGADDAVAFDIDADGYAERIGWTAAGASLAFLVADLNANRTIEDGAELFGIGTLLPNGERAPNGFVALRQYDANDDGVIDSSDPVWTKLLLWTDRNHNAHSEGTELSSINESEVTAIELAYHESHRRDAYGNSLRYGAHSRVGSGRKLFYDIFFVRAE